MTSADTIVKILVDQLGVELEVTPEARLCDDLGADSLDVAEVRFRIEAEYGISIPDAAVETWRTVIDVVRYIDTVTKPKGFRL